MADISEYINTIRSAIYGEDMRMAIAEAFSVINDRLVNSGSANNESYRVLTATHNLVETDTNYEILSKSEVEI